MSSNARGRTRTKSSRSSAVSSSGSAPQTIDCILERITDGFFAVDGQWRFTYVNENGATIFRRRRDELVGQHVWTVFPEAVGTRFQIEYERAMATGQAVSFEEYYQPYDGWYEINVYPSETGLSIYMRDVSERKRGETFSAALNAIHQLLLSELNREEIMRRVLPEAARAIGCDSAAISLCNGGQWFVRYVHGLPPETVGAVMNDAEEPHALLAIRTKEPVAIDDAFTDQRVNREHMKKWGVRSVMVVPLVVRDEAVGVVFLNSLRAPFAFQPSHLDFARQLAASMSLALDNARLVTDFQIELDERRRVEALLVRREAEYRSLAENSPSTLMRYDRDLRVVYLSPRATEATGVPAEQFLGKTNREMGMPAHLCDLWESAIAEVFQTGKPRDLEFDFPAPDGSRTFLLKLAPETTPEGGVAHVLGISTDITERKRNEAAVLESEERLRVTLTSIGDAVLATDHEGRVAFLNPVAAELTGWPTEEAAGRPISEVFRIINEKTRQPAEDIVERVQREGHVVELANHTALLCRDGREVPIEDSAAPIRDAAGNVTGVVLVFHDVTQQRHAQSALQELNVQLEARVRERTAAVERQNEILQNIIDHIPVMLTFYDANLSRFTLNRACERLIGYTADEANQMDFLKAMYPDPDYLRTVQEHMARADATWKDLEIVTRQGSRLPSSWANVRLSDGSSIGIGLDITERKQTEANLRAVNETLAHRAEQLRALTLELTRAEDRERRRLAAVLHDHLQQLLVGAKLTVGSLSLRWAEDKELQRGLGQVAGLLDQAIAGSRSLTAELAPPVLYEAGLRHGLLWLQKWMSEKHSLEVLVNAEEQPDKLSPDLRVLAFQAVRELLFNVVKHAGVKQASVTMSSDSDLSLRIEVSDEGAGFDSSILSERTGTGFGLFSIRERLEGVGGTLQVDSAPGQGTRTVMALPSAVHAELPGARSRAAAMRTTYSAMVEPAAGPRLRVLLAEDHRIVREGIARIIADEPDIEVIGEAGDGLEALELARRLAPDVVIMDVSMPLLDGIEATRQIKRERPGCRVIALTMHPREEKECQMREAGADVYLDKVRASELLVAAIRSAHQEGSVPEPGPRPQPEDRD